MENSVKTPEIIVNDNQQFSIPIYQRLFAWSPNEIKGLLEDLYDQYNTDKGAHYYIGLLTATKSNELVDGQQRFTAMVLIALALHNIDDRWKSFLLNGENLRLEFSAREDDRDYLWNRINNNEISQNNCNKQMEGAIAAINEFMADKSKFEPKGKKEDFSSFIYSHLAFFIQMLPDGYNGRLLNKYFESMNSSGRNLENHEILKVELLKETDLENEKYNRLVSLWNKASRMSQPILPFYDDAKRKEYETTIKNISENKFQVDEKQNEENGKTILDSLNVYSVGNTDAEKPSKFRPFLTFTDFLLQVLYTELKKTKRPINNTTSFFKSENLRTTFHTYEKEIKGIGIEKFIEDVYKYRIILDWAVIRTDGAGDYDLALNNSSKISFLEQYEAMLYASSSKSTYYKWIPEIFLHVEEQGANEPDLLKLLKSLDATRVDSSINLQFHQFDLNLFRILDYYIWEHIMNDGGCKELFPDQITPPLDLKTQISSYRFHQYNSVEHLYPQNEDEQTTELKAKWKNRNLDNIDQKEWIGNLALISDSFNSSQGNKQLSEKFYHIGEQIKNGCIQSLKLALMYFTANKDEWTPELAKAHGEKMIEFLQKTYRSEQQEQNS